MTEKNLPDLTGKVVLVYPNHSSEAFGSGLVLEYPEFREYGDRLFLYGRTVGWSGDNWNIPAAIAWDSISSFMIFSSRDELQSNMMGDSGLIGRLKRIAKP